MKELNPKQLMELKRRLKDPVVFTETTGKVKGKRFSFRGRPHLEFIYRDKHPRIVLVAGRQQEKTETIARKLIHDGYSRAYTTLVYTAPRQEQVTRFQGERFRSAIKDSIQGLLEASVDKEKDAKTRIGLTNKSIYYFGSAWSDGDALRGIPGDEVFFDEVQDMTQQAIEAIEKAVSHSEIKDPETELNGRCIYSGTPKIAGTYYDRVLWQKSDQKKWHVTCSCGEEQLLHFPSSIKKRDDGKNYYFACNKCGSELDRTQGRWIATKPENRLYSGYHLTQLNASWISANQIMRDYETMDEATFRNEVLGEFYTGAAKPVSLEDILACADKAREMQTRVVDYETAMGIDYGGGTTSKTIITIGHEERIDGVDKIVIDYIEDCAITDHEKLIQHIATLVNRYNVQKIVGDAGYGSYEGQKLFQMYGTMANSMRYVSYANDPTKREVKEGRIIQVDRTFSMDKTIDMFKKHRFVFPYKNPGEIEKFFDHYMSLEMELTESKVNSGRKLYTHRTPDDAFHSLNYLREAIAEINMTFEYEGVMREDDELAILIGDDADLPDW
jgi:hypothetical protein